MIYIRIINKGYFNENIIILGSSALAIDIFNEIDTTPDCGYSVKLMIPDTEDQVYPEAVIKKVSVKPQKKDLCSTVAQMDVKKVVVALEERRGTFPTDELIRCRTAGIDVIEGSSFYELLTGKLLVTKIKPSWLIFSDGFRKSKLHSIIKRIEDIVLSTVMITLLSPVLVAVGLFIKLDSKGPVFFSQDRVGQHKKTYTIHKFRSMVADAEKNTGPVWAQNDDSRITRVGKIIRKFRIDELPQLWDVFIGKMSMVGPRPERKFFIDDLEKKIPYYSERFVVKPGITGWAQISYDYGATIEDAVEKLNYDLFYIKNSSILMDMVIMLRTIKTVLFGKGAR